MAASSELRAPPQIRRKSRGRLVVAVLEAGIVDGQGVIKEPADPVVERSPNPPPSGVQSRDEVVVAQPSLDGSSADPSRPAAWAMFEPATISSMTASCLTSRPPVLCSPIS
jgi:hypothetical protein